MSGKVSPILRRCLSIAAFCYVFFGLGISGVPGWSSLAAISAAALIAILLAIACFQSKGPSLEKWVIFPFSFLALSGIADLYLRSQYEIVQSVYPSLAIAWIGALAITFAISCGTSLRLIVWAIVLSSFVNFLAAIAGVNTYYLFGANLDIVAESTALSRATGLVGNANVYAQNAIVPLFILTVWINHSDRWLWALASTSAAYAVYASGSRKGLVLFIIFILGILLIRPITYKRLAALAVAVLSVGVAVTIWDRSIVTTLSDNWVTFTRLIESQGASVENSRLDLAQASWQAVINRPIFGYGLNSGLQVLSGGIYSHNNFLELMLSGGLILLFSFYAMHAWIFIRINRHIRAGGRRYWALTLLMIVILLNDLTTVTYASKLITLVIVLSMWTVAKSGRLLIRTPIREDKRRGERESSN